ncbi:cell surface protein [Diaphorobacter sp. C33]|uniref:cell surface protein n=1 Tax=Diaphorobacter sp. C33 TaxID=3060154 RepID=UPI00265FA659|nr:cell surface protein [Diaphorobacter sp. C33]WKK89448.1 cell surface protein [Diaphorobacter sp. C33]
MNVQQGLLIDAVTPANSTMSGQALGANLALSEGGVGNMLLVPYYSAQNGNMTVLHVVNTDTLNGKAVKVRFRGAANSDDVMDFQVFMSPGDVWTAAVTAGADGVAQIQSADNTCTVPALGNNTPQAFATNRLDPNKSDAEKANGTREGYVEIFNMADIPSDKLYTVGTTANTNSALYTAIKHVNAVAPCSVAGSPAEATLFGVALTNYTAEADAANAGFNTPTGGLMGDWYIINVPETTTFSGASTAVVADGRGNFVHFPQIDTGVAAAAIDAFTADPLLRTDALKTDGTAFGATPALAAGYYDLPDMSTPYLAADIGNPKAQAVKLTSALAVTSVTNQYANDESITAKTDWVFSMPTRRYSVAANYAAISGTTPANDSNTSYRLFSDLIVGVTPDAAATLQDEWFFAANTPVSTDGKGNICVKADAQKFWDREETTPGASTPGPVFSPRTPGVAAVVSLCGEASVLAFKDLGNSVLASSVARSTITSGTYTNGWGVVTTANDIGAPGAGVVEGLPLMGASFIKLSNPQVAPGLSGTYGITWPHRFTR